MESWRQQPVVFWTFLLPGALWLLVFFLGPLALIWILSFGERSGPVEIVITGTLDNVREAIGICRTARTILGANGISLEYPVMRHATNLESVLTYEGTVEMHQLVLGKALTGLDAFR